MNKKFENVQWLDCGCCGQTFKASYLYQLTFDQDEGYGICPACEPDHKNVGYSALRERYKKEMLQIETIS